MARLGALLAVALSFSILASPVRAADENSLVALLRDVGLPPLHWGMSKTQVMRAAPGSEKGPACGGFPPPPASDVWIKDWRFHGRTGVLCFNFRKNRLQGVEFDGVVASRAEEEPITRQMLDLYGPRKGTDWPTPVGDRHMTWVFPDTIIFYRASDKPDGIHYGFDFVDRSQMCFMQSEDVEESLVTGKLDRKKCLPIGKGK